MTLLHLDSSILGGNSVSRTLSAAAVAKLTASNPSETVTYRDLSAHPIPHLSGEYLGASQAGEATHSAALQADLALGATVLDEFLAADTVVIGVGFYNFGIPSQLKAWVDRICVAGKTFRYTATGVEGLAGGKRVVVTIARGGVYAAGTPFAPFEHAETYLRGVFGFLGITDLEVIVAEGVAVGPDVREAAGGP
jgi:FMN-dependent NADH-azoreductase